MLSPEAIEKELTHKILKMIFAESDEGVSVGEIKSILQNTQEMIEGYRLEFPSPYGV